MRSAFDFAPYRRSTVGFDRLFDMLENSSVGQAGENYPPFDLIKLGDNEYRIELDQIERRIIFSRLADAAVLEHVEQPVEADGGAPIGRKVESTTHCGSSS